MNTQTSTNTADLAAMRQQQLTPREASLPSIKVGFFDIQSFELPQRTSTPSSRPLTWCPSPTRAICRTP